MKEYSETEKTINTMVDDYEYVYDMVKRIRDNTRIGFTRWRLSYLLKQMELSYTMSVFVYKVPQE